MSKKPLQDQPQKISGTCPHCGKELSPWEKVLLSVDRALTCKHCWYRIVLDMTGHDNTSDKKSTKG
jgi:DNA-directed RNA polymerase subunit RPC12/RpoP